VAFAAAVLGRCRLAFVGVLAFVSACSDGATRIAHDIESAAGALRRSGEARHSITHTPRSFPDGCSGAYTVQLSANSTLVVWCKRSGSGAITSSHATTYHLRFVKVPRTFKVDKAPGVPTIIELARENSGVVVTDVR